MTTSSNALSIERTKFFANGKGYTRHLYFGIRLTLTRPFDSVKAIHDFIQDEYFDNLGGSGHYWIMPESFKSQVTKDFADEITVDQAQAVQFNEDSTVVEILLRQVDYEDIDEEIQATNADLQEFVEAGFASHYEQFWLF